MIRSGWRSGMCVLGLMVALTGAARGQATLTGQVFSEWRPVACASIGVRGTVLGTAADEAGRYRLAGLRPGTYSIVASALGFSTAVQQVTLSDGDVRRLDFELEETVLENEGIVVTGTMQETFVYVQESPLIDPANPFGEHFDTAYVYGPLRGRHVGVGLRMNWQ